MFIFCVFGYILIRCIVNKFHNHLEVTFLPKYSDSLISEICAANDIIDLVSSYVELKRSGRDYSGLCPFHNEKSPSFHVSREKQLFHCFGCGASGNIIQFVMRTENLDFVDALKILADRAGIALPEDDNTYSDEEHNKRLRIYEMNKEAARFFYTSLTASEEGKTALRYFFERKITPKTITTYGLGFAPPSYDKLLNHLKSKGFTEDEIIDASLAVKRESRVYDKFRDRVMFPIINTRGDIIGFGGRIMDSTIKDGYKPPKYLNSGETAVFNKGRNLFSLNLAKNSGQASVILCEGYMDVISVYQAGITNIVATLGTAVTEEQVRLLMRYSEEILLCYDSDEAGQKATLRAIDIITSAGARAKVIKLKNAKDPDEYIKTNGIAMFKTAISQAVPAMKYKLSLLKLKYDLSDTDNKVSYIREAMDALSSLSNAVEIDAYIDTLAKEADISKDAVYAEYKKNTRKTAAKKDFEKKQSFIKSAGTVSSQHTPVKTIRNPVTEAEKRLLSIMARDKKAASDVRAELEPKDFSSDVYTTLAEMIYAGWDAGHTPEVSVLVNAFSNDIDRQNEAASVFYNHEIYSADSAAVRELLDSIILGKINNEINSGTVSLERINELIKKKTEINERRSGM